MLKVTGIASIAVIAWLAFVGYSAFGGLWMSPVVAEGDTEAFFEYAVQNLQENNRGAASLLMIEDGVIVNEFHDWANEVNVTPEQIVTRMAKTDLLAWAAPAPPAPEDQAPELGTPPTEGRTPRWVTDTRIRREE